MNNIKDRDATLSACLTFFEKIGIPYQFDSFSEDSFLPGVKIRDGGLVIDKEKLLYPGDLLHEAGHIAIEPENSRSSLNDNVRECGQGDAEEMAAIAWSWAALTQLNIAPEVVFHENGYLGGPQSLIDCYQQGGYLGQPLLQFYDMCKLKGEGSFPRMECWLRPPSHEV